MPNIPAELAPTERKSCFGFSLVLCREYVKNTLATFWSGHDVWKLILLVTVTGVKYIVVDWVMDVLFYLVKEIWVLS